MHFTHLDVISGSQVKKLKEIERENARLKKNVTDLSLEKPCMCSGSTIACRLLWAVSVT